MPAKVKISGTYRTVPDADLFLKQSNSYSGKPVTGGYVKVNNGYKQFHQGSDPQTYYFVANDSMAGRGTSWKTNSNQGGSDFPQISRYVTAYPWYGLVLFNQDTSGVSLSSRLATRPVVKSAYFNVMRWNDGGFGSGYGNLYIGRYTGDHAASNPSYTFCNFSSYASKSWSGSGSNPGTNVSYSDNFLTRAEFVGGDPGGYRNGIGIADGGIELGSARQTLVDHLANYPSAGSALCLSYTTNTGTSSGGLGHYGSATTAQQANYWNFYNAGATVFGVQIGPTLVVTLDFV
jgi:hypothetical protein